MQTPPPIPPQPPAYPPPNAAAQEDAHLGLGLARVRLSVLPRRRNPGRDSLSRFFAKARQRARDVSCLSNEKQMGLALLQYAQGNDDKFPYRPDWMDATATYRTGDERMLHCPAVWGQDPTKYGYAFNSTQRGKNIIRVSRPEAVPMVYDSTNLSRNATDPARSLPSPPRHGTGNNVAFVDGHVKTTMPGVGP